MSIFTWLKRKCTPSFKVRCIDCGKIIDINKDSHYWWTDTYGKAKDKERTLVQCMECAQEEHKHEESNQEITLIDIGNVRRIDSQ